MKPTYFGGGQTLFPTWPMQDSERALSLLFWTLTLLLVPKLFGFFVALFSSERRRGFGGMWGLTTGIVMETALSSLFAHVMMMVQSAAILDILRGGEECVCHIQSVLGKRQAYVSQQLMLLRDAGLVVDRREGLNVYYRIVEPRVGDVLDVALGRVDSRERCDQSACLRCASPK